MMQLVCMLEERSAAEMLKVVLKKLLPNTVIKCIVFEGKQDMEKRVEKRLRYWQQPNTYFLVMRDKDSGDCRSIKRKMAQKVQNSGKMDKTLIRIACHELESFYLGDLSAVEKGLHLKSISKQQNKRKYRTPDQLSNAAAELDKLTKEKYEKLQGSRCIAPHLKLDGTNTSHSFNALICGIRNLIS
jgi:hypothetical protein